VPYAHADAGWAGTVAPNAAPPTLRAGPVYVRSPSTPQGLPLLVSSRPPTSSEELRPRWPLTTVLGRLGHPQLRWHFVHPASDASRASSAKVRSLAASSRPYAYDLSRAGQSDAQQGLYESRAAHSDLLRTNADALEAAQRDEAAMVRQHTRMSRAVVPYSNDELQAFVDAHQRERHGLVREPFSTVSPISHSRISHLAYYTTSVQIRSTTINPQTRAQEHLGPRQHETAALQAMIAEQASSSSPTLPQGISYQGESGIHLACSSVCLNIVYSFAAVSVDTHARAASFCAVFMHAGYYSSQGSRAYPDRESDGATSKG
jgi:hypothetical protein